MIYLHVPFCRSFCFYCSFYSELACKGKDAELFGKLLSEVDATWREALSLYEVTSDKVYVRMPAPATYETFMAQGGETFFENVKTAFKKELGIMFKNK